MNDSRTSREQALSAEVVRLRARVADLERRLRKTAGSAPRQAATTEFRKIHLDEFAAFAIENIADATYLVSKDARIVYVNNQACQHMGYTEEELIGLRIMDINPTVTDENWDAIFDVTATDRFQVIETVHQKKDGTIVPIEVLASYLEIDGEPYSCSFTRDISARKEMEARIRQSEKMEAIGHLAGGIAHDFNNQLSGIMAYADMLRLKQAAQSDCAQYVEGIMTAARRSAGLTTQLLAFASRGKYLSVAVDLHKLIYETIRMLERSINKNIRIARRFEAHDAVTTGDPAQIENALLNLAINARDAMPSGGDLTFSTAIVELDDGDCSASIFDIEPGRYVRVAVTDTGVGMDEETRRRVFEPFFTTKADGKGTGMGLPSVYGTMKNHKGAVEVHSREGNGTEVLLYLRSTPEKAPIEDAAKSAVDVNLSARVLLVDDDDVVRTGTHEMLKQMGCRVITAENGAEALAVYERSFRELDIVILDLVMPGLGGRETLRRMRKINPDIVALLISGFGMEKDVRAMLGKGAIGFLQKPFLFKELADTLSAILEVGGESL